MVRDFFATKLGMTQAWTKSGKRLAITRCKADDIAVISSRTVSVIDTADHNRASVPTQILEVGYGTKKLKNMSKPLRTQLTKGGFSVGVKKIMGIHVSASENETDNITPGQMLAVDSVLSIGDVVQVQGQSKGRGFAGAIKRHGFHGGPATHGQSDRARAVGSIGNRTTPGRVWVGKRMPGHYGDEKETVLGLVVVHIDPTTKEVWLSGPVPGSISGLVKIHKTGKTKNVELDLDASGIKPVAPVEEKTEATTEVVVSEEKAPEVVEETKAQE